MSDAHLLLPAVEAIARRAGRVAQDCRANSTIELKPDGSLVTNGDTATERYLRDALSDLIGGTQFWGEEMGYGEQGPEGLWVLDPIDGTSNYAFGSPLWGVSIGLVQDDVIVLGALFLPDLNEMYLAAKGSGATANGQRMPMIPPGRIQPYELVSYNDHVIAATQGSDLPGKMRHAGSVVVDGAFVAQQRYRGLMGVREKLYDICAALAMLEELDADIRFVTGEPLEIKDLLKNEKVGKPWIAFPKGSGFGLSS